MSAGLVSLLHKVRALKNTVQDTLLCVLHRDGLSSWTWRKGSTCRCTLEGRSKLSQHFCHSIISFPALNTPSHSGGLGRRWGHPALLWTYSCSPLPLLHSLPGCKFGFFSFFPWISLLWPGWKDEFLINYLLLWLCEDRETFQCTCRRKRLTDTLFPNRGVVWPVIILCCLNSTLFWQLYFFPIWFYNRCSTR